MSDNPNLPRMYAESETVRRKLAAAYAEDTSDSKWTPAERAEFARMAEFWAMTLPGKPKK